MKNLKIRVGVFMGGKSIEREVSLNSGRTVCDHLDTDLYEVIPIYQKVSGQLYILPWRFLHRGKTSDFEHRLDNESTSLQWDDLKDLVDFIYLAVHGRYAEDGILQGMLEVLGIPYLGSRVFSSALMANKIFHKEVLRNNGIQVPRDVVVRSSELKKIKNNVEENLFLKNILQKLKLSKIELPVIVKPSNEGSSLGISVVHKEEELIKAIFYAAKSDSRILQDILIEEKLEGMEFVCVPFEKSNGEWEVLPPTEILKEKGSDFFDYTQKYMPGRANKITPARCSDEELKLIKQECLKATKILCGRTIARLDGFLTKDGRAVLIDPQPITGMAPSTMLFNQAAQIGMGHTDLINHLINIELQKYGLVSKAQNKSKASMESSLKNKIKIVVLLGGDSDEREISLESGRNICYKLSPNKYEVIPVFVSNEMELYRLNQKLLVKNSTSDIVLHLTDELKIKWSDLPKVCDFVFIALHGGKGENGCVQGALEMLGLPYNGSSVLESSLCMDKYATAKFLKDQGFYVPDSIILDKKLWQKNKGNIVKDILKRFKVPFILKPQDNGCSVFVRKINDSKDLEKELESYFLTKRQTVMIEEFIDAIELTCGVFGNDDIKSLIPSQPIISKDILSLEEKFLPGVGENQTPANIPFGVKQFVMKTMEETYKAIGCKGYARIDCFYQDAKKSPTGEARVIILEINTLPGMTPATCIFHQAAEIGIHPMEFIDKIIELGFEYHKKLSNEVHIPLERKESALLIN
ncbi:ATP-grasp domain-containing protein [Candidatus Babeliales bacterium]|nr:ATP-grasp domain-containing protein [Candidatus Babeliales bacterium]